MRLNLVESKFFFYTAPLAGKQDHFSSTSAATASSLWSTDFVWFGCPLLRAGQVLPLPGDTLCSRQPLASVRGECSRCTTLIGPRIETLVVSILVQDSNRTLPPSSSSLFPHDRKNSESNNRRPVSRRIVARFVGEKGYRYYRTVHAMCGRHRRPDL